jgi:hypothetical protein
MSDQYDTPYTVTMNPLPMAHSMTLRDWFAGQALVAYYERVVVASVVEGWPEDWRYGAAQEAYQMADAMLAAREVQK